MLLEGRAVIAVGQNGHLSESRNVFSHHDARVERFSVRDLRIHGQVAIDLFVHCDDVGEDGLDAGAHCGQTVTFADNVGPRRGPLAGQQSAACVRNKILFGAFAPPALAHTRSDRIHTFLNSDNRNPRAEDCEDFFELLKS